MQLVQRLLRPRLARGHVDVRRLAGSTVALEGGSSRRKLALAKLVSQLSCLRDTLSWY